MDCKELFKIREEISIFQNYEIIAPLHLTIPNNKTLNIISYSKSRFVKFQNVTSFNRYENTIEADKIEYIMYYPDGLFIGTTLKRDFI
ncbi:40167_t:CDS:2, partial [Gigaspora margarita]